MSSLDQRLTSSVDSVAMSRAEIAEALIADRVAHDRRHADDLIRGYLDATSRRMGVPVHRWGLDSDDLDRITTAAIAADVQTGDAVTRARRAVAGLPDLTDADDVAVAAQAAEHDDTATTSHTEGDVDA